MSATAELQSAVDAARAIEVSIRTAGSPAQAVQLHLWPHRPRRSCMGWVGLVTATGEHLRQRVAAGDTVEALLDAVRPLLGDAALAYETLEVKTTKSPRNGRALRPVVLEALAERFAQPVPEAAELRALQKAHAEVLELEKAERQRVAQVAQRAEARRAAAELRRHQPEERVTDVPTFLAGLQARIGDPGRIKKATSMLKKSGFQLFHDISDDEVVGVVKSQTDASLVYASRLAADGSFACCTQNLNACGGLRGKACKHLLVLIIGLVQSGELDPVTMDSWLERHLERRPELDRDAMGDVFLKYKGAEAGELDWRPTETTPEDFYAY